MDAVRRTGRWALVILTGLFMIGVVVEFLLAGFALFGETSWEAHETVGNTVVHLVSLLVLFAALAAWPGRGLPLLGALIFVLTTVQVFLPEVESGWVAGLHPLNALVLFLLAHATMRRAAPLVREPALPPAA